MKPSHSKINSANHINFNIKNQIFSTNQQLKQLQKNSFAVSRTNKKKGQQIRKIEQLNQSLRFQIKDPTIEFICCQINNKFKRFLNDKRRTIKKKSLQNTKINNIRNLFEKNNIKNEGKCIHTTNTTSLLFQNKKNMGKYLSDFDDQNESLRYKVLKPQKQQYKNNFDLLKIIKYKMGSGQNKIINIQQKQQYDKRRQMIRPYKRMSLNNMKISKQGDISLSTNSSRKTMRDEIKHKINTLSKSRPKQKQQAKKLKISIQLVNPTICFNPQKFPFDPNFFDPNHLQKNKFGQAFSILHHRNSVSRILLQHNPQNTMEIASLTKTMTCLIILLISSKFKIDLKTQFTYVSLKAAQLKGTSAKLMYGDILSIYDLLHGLMLPSGNDAAIVLGQWGGKRLRLQYKKLYQNQRESKSIKKIFCERRKSNISLFIIYMNKMSKYLEMNRTQFTNVHGLMNKKNYSCASDLIKLNFYCMQRQDFSNIVSKKQYQTSIKNKKFRSERLQIWQNTNKLLMIPNYCGIKTGITPTAGPCLSSCYKIRQKEFIYIVLLKSQSAYHRFQQSKKLLIQCLKQLYKKENEKIYLNILIQLQKNQGLKEEMEDINNIEVSDQQNYEEQKTSDIQ